MKLKTVVATMAAVLATGAFAGEHSINVVGRGGWTYRDNDSRTVPNSSSFDLDFLRTTFAGAVTPSIKYYVTTDLLAASRSNDHVDNTSAFIDEAFVTKTFATGTGITFGKKTVLLGGREYDYLNADRYSTSAFINAAPANQVGLTLTQEFEGNTLMAQYFNGNKENGHDGTNAQSKFGYSVGWYGNLANGMVKPIVAYTVVPEAAGSDTTIENTARVNKGDDKFLGAGAQFNVGRFTVEGDYGLLTEKDAAGSVTAKQDLKTTSIVGLLRYSTDRCAPFAKFIKDTHKLDSIKVADRTGYDLGVEFKEAKDDMIRYHVVYSGATAKAYEGATTTKTSPKSVMVGLKFDASILK